MHARRSRTRETVLAIASLTALTMGLVIAGVPPSQATHAIHAVELTQGNRGEFTDDVSMQIRAKLDGRRTQVLNLSDASHVTTAQLTVQPGAQFPWHTHPGPVIVTVTQGLLVYVQADDCVPRPYPAGTAFIDPGNRIHTAYAPTGTDETVVIATFLDAPEAGPLTIPETDEDLIAELDARCAIDRDSDGSD